MASNLLVWGGRELEIMAVATLNPGEESQLLQTIEMFEVIAQSQPNDCQSLEILKEAYSKLGRTSEAIAELEKATIWVWVCAKFVG